MRMLRGKPVEQNMLRLSPDQTALLDAVVKADETEFQRVRDARDELKERVVDALDHGVPAKIIAASLGVSRGRVYQMKDELEASRAGEPLR